MESSSTILESQADWLTVTAKHDGQRRALADHAFGLGQAELEQGAKTIPFRLRQYTGWTMGRVHCGQSRDSTIVQLSGDLARSAFDDTFALADRVTRLDLAVTYRQEPFQRTHARRGYVQYQRWREGHSGAADSNIRLGSDSAGTLYIGDRSSERYFRLYDKASESGDERYRQCWRAELECKGNLAGALASAYLGSSDRYSLATSYLHDYLTARGITPGFERNGSPLHLTGFRRRSDTERSLSWAERQVMPALTKLADRGEDERLRAIIEPLAHRLWPSLNGRLG